MIVLRRCLWLLVAALALLAGGGTPVGGGAVAAQPPSVRFVENVGQWPDALRFRTMGGTQRWAVADRALWLTLYDAASDGNQTGLQLRFDLSGASPNSRWEAVEPLGGSLSFYEGASRYERVPQWGGLRLRGYREGVDLLLGSDSAGLRVTLLPTMLGAVLPRAIPLELHGASATLGADGAALAVSNGGEQRMARLPRGVAWRVATPSGDVLTVRPTATARGDAPSTFSPVIRPAAAPPAAPMAAPLPALLSQAPSPMADSTSVMARARRGRRKAGIPSSFMVIPCRANG